MNGLRKAFTIAEIVMAMLVVTFIAMLMMPTLVNDSEKNVAAAGLAKAYTQLQDIAGGVALMESRGTVVDRTNLAYSFLHDVTPVIQRVVVFDANHTFADYTRGYNPLFADGNNGVTDISDADVNAGNVAARNAIFLKNGVALVYIDGNTIAVDVNGKKPPNRSARDIFYFTLATDAATGRLSAEPTMAQCNFANIAQTTGCAYKIIYQDEGRITYY